MAAAGVPYADVLHVASLVLAGRQAQVVAQTVDRSSGPQGVTSASCFGAQDVFEALRYLRRRALEIFVLDEPASKGIDTQVTANER